MNNKSSKKYVVYRDLKRDGFDNQYELMDYSPKPGDKVIKEQIVPGQFGYPDMYIRRLLITWNNQCIPIFSYTDYELTDFKKIEICARSGELLDELN